MCKKYSARAGAIIHSNFTGVLILLRQQVILDFIFHNFLLHTKYNVWMLIVCSNFTAEHFTADNLLLVWH